MQRSQCRQRQQRQPWWLFCGTVFGVLLVWNLCPLGAQAVFDSGLDGSDGALTLSTPGSVAFFDPASFDRPLDADGDGVYHFTTVTIAEGVTVDMTRAVRGPVTWLATGEVRVDGMIDLNGETGHADIDSGGTSRPGAGGFSGGHGQRVTLPAQPAQPGQGPGGRQVSLNGASFWGGGGAGHASPGTAGSSGVGGAAGRMYGNRFMLPLLGGSGGGGGAGSSPVHGGGGGAGGGALLIASSERISVQGTITAQGGGGGSGHTTHDTGGGGGSGGSIRLIAPVIEGEGTLSVVGGFGHVSSEGGDGAPGRIRAEAFSQAFSGSVFPPIGIFSAPGVVSISASQAPVRIVSIDGVAVPENPTGGFSPPDVVLDAATATTITLAAQGVPLGTIIRITVISESVGNIVVESTPLEGTLEASTATAEVIIPHGFVHFLVEAMWEP